MVKIIVVGNGQVGKTSLTTRYCKGTFTTQYKKSIGVDYMEKSIDLAEGQEVKLMIWDTAGQEEFDALTSSYYRGAGGAVIVFSTTDRQSFDAIAKWKSKVEAECGPRIPLVLVQNKIDLVDQATMTECVSRTGPSRRTRGRDTRGRTREEGEGRRETCGKRMLDIHRTELVVSRAGTR